ncbi:hypothetical protein C7B65_23535 [Phormidesmis priestleyi ULC007]|uniref:Tetratricopeptide repeat protein n=1 Tax=Phormidesmis priestleyi ULC007 TaxID=1920490 RepID=A0A2T1D5N9_9CYAN|nr:hypothetical protein [Phormidesmis priestleyi]PSB15789.1 hypothetical protein C7B65_23535 [Phormidesmis priestleyi ULC007]PZO46810.1 MAG: hypothetical protein DCF14_21675 [Phormidesmis priestleyi]
MTIHKSRKKAVILYLVSSSIVFVAIVGGLRIVLLSMQGIPFTTIEEDIRIYKDPNNALAHFNRGWIRSQSGDREGAIADFTEAIKIVSSGKDKNSSLSLVGLYDDRGQVYNHLGGSAEDRNPAEAQKNYRLAISDYQKSAELCKLESDKPICSMIVDNIEWVKKSLSEVSSKN